RRHTRSKRDWSSDVCSSDLVGGVFLKQLAESIIKDAYDSGASDIHITFEKTGGSVRKRVRGKMAAVRMLETDMLKRLINYLKFRSEERRVGKEGRSRMRAEQ